MGAGRCALVGGSRVAGAPFPPQDSSDWFSCIIGTLGHSDSPMSVSLCDQLAKTPPRLTLRPVRENKHFTLDVTPTF
jgi:hypothetical protein